MGRLASVGVGGGLLVVTLLLLGCRPNDVAATSETRSGANVDIAGSTGVVSASKAKAPTADSGRRFVTPARDVRGLAEKAGEILGQAALEVAENEAFANTTAEMANALLQGTLPMGALEYSSADSVERGIQKAFLRTLDGVVGRLHGTNLWAQTTEGFIEAIRLQVHAAREISRPRTEADRLNGKIPDARFVFQVAFGPARAFKSKTSSWEPWEDEIPGWRQTYIASQDVWARDVRFEKVGAVEFLERPWENGVPYPELWARVIGAGENALSFLGQSAAAGDCVAQETLGELLLTGANTSLQLTTAINAKEGIRWLEMAAKQGSSWALAELGDAYANGTGVERSPDRAIGYSKRAAALGHIYAMEGVGVALVTNDTTRAEGLAYLSRAASIGGAVAHAWLGGMYTFGNAYGKGVKQDTKKAIEHLRNAGYRGQPMAFLDLGDVYAKGDGLAKKDIPHAWAAYRMALRAKFRSDLEIGKEVVVVMANEKIASVESGMTGDQRRRAEACLEDLINNAPTKRFLEH